MTVWRRAFLNLGIALLISPAAVAAAAFAPAPPYAPDAHQFISTHAADLAQREGLAAAQEALACMSAMPDGGGTYAPGLEAASATLAALDPQAQQGGMWSQQHGWKPLHPATACSPKARRQEGHVVKEEHQLQQRHLIPFLNPSTPSTGQYT